MEHGEKMQVELRKREEEQGGSTHFHVCLYKDRVGGDVRGSSHPPGDARGGPGQGEGHPSRTCDTWYTVAPSYQEERGWGAVKLRRVLQLLLYEDI